MMANAAAEQTETIWSFFSGGGRGGQQPSHSRNLRLNQLRRLRAGTPAGPGRKRS